MLRWHGRSRQHQHYRSAAAVRLDEAGYITSDLPEVKLGECFRNYPPTGPLWSNARCRPSGSAGDSHLRIRLSELAAMEIVDYRPAGSWRCKSDAMNESETIDKLVAACKAYHAALDNAFAMLINVTRGVKYEPFFPSRSPMWPAMVEGKQLVDEIENGRSDCQRPSTEATPEPTW